MKLQQLYCELKSLLLYVAIIAYHNVAAQEEFVPPQATLLTKFSFTQLSGGIIIVRARIDDIADTLNFVLDTGSGGISLDSETVVTYKMVTAISDKTIRGIAGIKTVAFTNNHTLQLPGLAVQHLDFHINNYDLLTSVYGVKIDGIIGFSFFRRYIVKIDYDILKIEILAPGTIKYPKGGYLMKPNFASLVFPQAQIADERVFTNRFIFDTGAGLCMLLSEDYVSDSMVLRKKSKRYLTQAEGLGGKKTMDITVIKSVQLGNYKFRKVPVYIFADDYNVTSYPLLGGLLGNDLLRRFNITLNYPEQSIYLKPNSHFKDGFDYSYTGLGIYQIEQNIVVVDIMPNSPGEKAGFKPDDIILSIDNNFSNNVQVFKTALQNAGNIVRILVLRKGQPLLLKLRIKNILRS
jgi:hypothetical protein